MKSVLAYAAGFVLAALLTGVLFYIARSTIVWRREKGSSLWVTVAARRTESSPAST